MEESSPREGGISMDELDDEEAYLSLKLALHLPMEEAVVELATEASLPLLSPPLPLHRSAASTIEPCSSPIDPLHPGVAIDWFPRLLAVSVELKTLRFLLCDASNGRI
jgi:hypothetical protein